MSFIFIVFFIFISCSNNGEEPEEVFARVGNKTLTKKDLVEMKKVGLVSEGSVSNLVNNWVEKTLLYNAAININLDKDIVLAKKRDVFYKNLLVSSFLDIKSKKEISVSKKEISNYYNKNKKSFTRNSDEILLKHFVLPTNKEAIKVKKFLKSNKKGEEFETLVKKYKPETKTVKKGLIGDNLIGFVFKYSIGDVVGPKLINGYYHVFDILKKHNKKSVRGLELVYNEIHQRIFKTKEIQFLDSVLDSLFLKNDVYISPEVGG
ncbi:MAG: peptidyl-prolyl cis-trans isomerase [Candidatus Neomarinimicrobiota bacterium]